MITRRYLLRTGAAAALAGGGNPRAATRKPRPNRSYSPGRSIPAGGRNRLGRAHPCQPAVRSLGPAGGDREQGWRRQQYRRGSGGSIGPRRLHAPDRLPAARGQPLPLYLPQLRPGCRLRADHADRGLSQSHGGPELLARQIRQWSSLPTPRRIRGRITLRLVRRRHLDPSVRRAVQANDRDRDDARALPRGGAGVERRHPRPGRCHVQHHGTAFCSRCAPDNCADLP